MLIVRRYRCNSCSSTFTRKASAKRHIEDIHNFLAAILDPDGNPLPYEPWSFGKSRLSGSAKPAKTANDQGIVIYAEEIVRELARLEAWRLYNKEENDEDRHRLTTKWTRAYQTIYQDKYTPK